MFGAIIIGIAFMFSKSPQIHKHSYQIIHMVSTTKNYTRRACSFHNFQAVMHYLTCTVITATIYYNTLLKAAGLLMFTVDTYSESFVWRWKVCYCSLKVRTFKELCGFSETKQVMINEQKLRDNDFSIVAVC